MKFITKNIYCCLIFCICFSCEKTAEKEIYFIPSNYIGQVVIFYNQSNGKAIKYKDGYRIYDVTNNGTLCTQFPPNDGWSAFDDQIYFQINDDKKLNKIPYRRMGNDINNPPDSIVQIFGSTNGRKGNLIYQSFYIGKYNKRPSINIIKQNQEFENIIKIANVKE